MKRLLCRVGIHHWVLFKKELHQYQALNSVGPDIDFHYGCNGCGKQKVETREEGDWRTFKSEHLSQDVTFK